jgi:hypothetical protein
MKTRSEIDALNGHRLEDYHRQDLLDEYYFVEFTRFPDETEMTSQEAADAGFFTETASAIIRVTTVDEAGQLKMQSAFVAGKSSPEAPRHDKTAITQVAAKFGVDIEDLNSAETLARPLLIRKDSLPNGVIDLVREYDEAVGGTFFGEQKPAQDYLAYRDVCRQREFELESVVEEITEKLIAESTTLNTPLDASNRLHQLSEKLMVDRTIEDDTINPRVFGQESANYINQARLSYAQGNWYELEAAREKAQSTARSYSCPSGAQRSAQAEHGLKGDNSNTNSGEKCPEIKNGQITRCPFCKNKVRAIVPNKETIYCSNPACPRAAPRMKGQEKPEKKFL